MIKSSYTRCLHRLFEEQAKQAPDSIAIVHKDEHISYNELNRRADELSVILRHLNVGPDTLIAISLEPSPQLIVGLLAILKAGGAYVPVDSSQPMSRLQFILGDTKSTILITQNLLKDKFSWFQGALLIIDSEELQNKQTSYISRPLVVNTNLAYVIYTSGSTGKPKGVCVDHENVVRLFIETAHWYNFNSKDVMLLFHTYAFDFSVWEIWGALIYGARLVIASPMVVRDLELLSNLLEQEFVTVLSQTPSAFAQLVLYQSKLINPKSYALRFIIFGGEPPQVLPIKQWMDSKLCPNAILVNMYGITEITVHGTFRIISKADTISNQVTLIGEPIPDLKILLLTDQMDIVLEGEEGEICVGGTGLARCYLNLPALTAERFLADPFSNSGSRLYRSGDVGRSLSNGDIDYIGRIDHQVKIRGYRVELKEIEFALSELGVLKQVAVKVREDSNHHKYLIAYIVPIRDSDDESEKQKVIQLLRSYVSEKLPEYMVPAIFVVLKMLPLNINGKIDVEALPIPEHSFQRVQEEFVAPKSNLHQILASIWSKILGIDKIGINDHFFHMGGHSHLVMQVIFQIRERLKISLQFRTFFEYPTISRLADRIEQIEKEQLQVNLDAILPQKTMTWFPLSPAQRGLWFFYQLFPSQGLYNIHLLYELSGPLNLENLQKAFHHLLDRHEFLRVRFKLCDDEVFQYIDDKLTFSIHFHDSESEAYRPFELLNEPVHRVSLMKVSENRYQLLWVFHHIISDGWSLDLLLRDLSVLYNGLQENKSSILPKLPINYLDFVVWQKTFFQIQELDSQIKYWQKQLGDIPDILKLPYDYTRPPQESYRGTAVSDIIPLKSYEKLKINAQERGVTVYMFLLAAFQLFLYKYSGQNNIVVGTPIANRHYPGVQNLVGFFVNSVPICTRFQDSLSLEAFLKHVQNLVFEAHENQDLPFEQLVDLLKIKRDLSRHPIFQVMFVFENQKNCLLSLNQIESKKLDLDTPYSRFDLTLWAEEKMEGLCLKLEYAQDLFTQSTINQFMRHLKFLLEELAIVSPEATVGELSLLPIQEQKKIRRHSEGRKNKDSRNQCIHRLIEERARLAPSKIALIYGDEFLTYEALNQRANQLANIIRIHRINIEDRIIIALEPSSELFIAILSVLKAGACYVILDLTQPLERISHIINNSKPSLIITRIRLKERFERQNQEVVCIDQDWETIANLSCENSVVNLNPQILAYVIYTSGSTGIPKGVSITQKSLLEYLFWFQELHGFTSEDRFDCSSSLSFDLSVTSYLAPLLFGGTICACSEQVKKDPILYLAYLQKHLATFLKITPGYFSQLKEFVAEESSLSRLRCIVLGGETVDTHDVSSWLSVHHSHKIVNEYGPTETTVGVSSYEVNSDFEKVQQRMPIGRPATNTELFVLDSSLNLLPYKVEGELHIGGDFLARGYLGRPDLTAQKFIPNPLSDQGLCLYKTGDLVRLLFSNDFDCLGRIDNQVKVRGYRVELGEIEHILKSHEKISDAIVRLHDEDGLKKIVAYVIPSKNSGLLPESLTTLLREYIHGKLPDYMLPNAFIFMTCFPLSSSGKIDNKALPKPNFQQRQVEDRYIAPRTNLEILLHEIWSQLLGVNKISIRDNFFEIGGDSIISIQLVSKARQRGIYIEIKQVFQSPTIEKLAQLAILKQSRNEKSVEAVVGDLPLTPIQHWFFEQKWYNHNHYNQSMLLETHKPLDSVLLEKAFQYLVNHHDSLRLRFRKKEDGWKESYQDKNKSVAFFQVLSEPLTEDKELEIESRLDISNGPLIYATLFDSNHNQKLFIVIHHLVVDGVSWRILLEDLAKVYAQLENGEHPFLANKTDSFRAWSLALQKYSLSEELGGQISYWNNQLNDFKLTSLLDYDKGLAQVSEFKIITTILDKTATQMLLRQVPRAFKTEINDILLTALTLAVGDLTNKYTLYVDLEGHGREDIDRNLDISQTVGWFTTIFPMRLSVASTIPEEALKNIKEQLRAIPQKGLGYGVLKFLKGGLNPHPSPEISFNYLGQWKTNDFHGQQFFVNKRFSKKDVDERNHCLHCLEINSEISEGILKTYWKYSQNHFSFEKITKLSQSYMNRLKELILHCCKDQVFGYTPSDFPLAQLKQETLDDLFGKQPGIEDIYPLSPIQEGLLFTALYHPNSDFYLTQKVFMIEGKLDINHFEEAWRQITRLYPIFRTSFYWQGVQRPLQVVYNEACVVLNQHDWNRLEADQAEEELQKELKKDRLAIFDLTKAPLMRFQLIKRNTQRYYMIWSFHHLLLDGWSTNLVLSHFLECYSLIRSSKNNLTISSPKYRYYIEWISKQDQEQAKVFWKDYLKGYEEVLSLSHIEYQKPEASYESSQLFEDSLSIALTAQLKKFAKSYGITLNTLLQTTWGLLLGYYTQKRDLICGVTVSGRSAPIENIESLVGILINTIPFRLRYSPFEEVMTLLRRVQEELAELHQYSYLSGAKIQACSDLKIKRQLFETIFVFENFPHIEKTSKRENEFNLIPILDFERTEYPLLFSAIDRDPLHFQLSFDSSQFRLETIETLFRHYRTFLESIIVNPQARIGSLIPLSTEEKNRLYMEWNQPISTKRKELEYETVIDLFDKQNRTVPDRVVAIYGEEQLTYKELNRRAVEVAQRLRMNGISLEKRVVVCLPSSLEQLISMLGVLKAGGVYVPINPDYPLDRINFVLKETQAAIVITHAGFLNRFEEYSGAILNWNENDLETIAQDDIGASYIHPQNLAYIIYTSGSTGYPKGIAVEHANLYQCLHWLQQYCPLDAFDNMLQHTSLSFDVSIEELLWPICYGAKVVIIPFEDNLKLDLLIENIKRNIVTIVEFVPSMLKAFLEEEHVKECQSLKQIFVGGEVLTRNIVELFFAKFNIDLHNIYGPTETTIDASAYHLKKGSFSSSTVPIGYPNTNTHMHILNIDFNPLPIGSKGELYIAGKGIARGYLNRASLTAEKFLPNPFPESGLRLYRTGDLARYTPSGTIEYCGRIDYQVKLRGNRIEIEDIESILLRYEGVDQAVVTLVEGPSSQKELVAYISGFGKLDHLAIGGHKKNLKAYLQDRLPSYMIPSQFVFLESMPLTTVGKIDRQSLPIYEFSQKQRMIPFVNPTTQVEEMLQQIWEELLGIDQIGIHDNFFELGGDSIVSIQLVSKARQRGVHFEIKQVFQNPTIAQLASTARLKSIKAPQDSTNKKFENISLTPIQKWFFEQDLVNKNHYNQSVFLKFHKTIDPVLMNQAFKYLVDYHDAFQLRFRKTGGQWVQFYTNENLTSIFEYHKGLSLAAIETKKQKAASTLDIEKGPLIRALLFEEEVLQTCYITAHHLIVDGVSWRILLNDLESIYKSLEKGEPVFLPPKTFSYTNWPLAIQKYADSNEFKKQHTFWLKTIKK